MRKYTHWLIWGAALIILFLLLSTIIGEKKTVQSTSIYPPFSPAGMDNSENLYNMPPSSSGTVPPENEYMGYNPARPDQFLLNPDWVQETFTDFSGIPSGTTLIGGIPPKNELKNQSVYQGRCAACKTANTKMPGVPSWYTYPYPAHVVLPLDGFDLEPAPERFCNVKTPQGHDVSGGMMVNPNIKSVYPERNVSSTDCLRDPLCQANRFPFVNSLIDMTTSGEYARISMKQASNGECTWCFDGEDSGVKWSWDPMMYGQPKEQVANFLQIMKAQGKM